MLPSACTAIILKKADISHFNQKLIKLRSGALSVKNVCGKHYDDFVVKFASRQKSCCMCGKTKLIRAISYDFYKDHRKYCVSPLVPGKALCIDCRILCQQQILDEQNKRAQLAEDGGYVEPPDPGSPYVSDDESSAAGSSSTSQATSQGTSQNRNQDNDDVFPTPPEVAKERLNQALGAYNISPADPRKLSRSVNYAAAKMGSLQAAITDALVKAGTSKDIVVNQDAEDFSIMMKQLIEKYRETESMTEKFQVLSVVPKNWTLQQVIDKFGCTRNFARLVKKKVETDNILCKPNPKPGKRLPESTVKKIVDFYEEEQNSRSMPGKRDFKTVKINGVRKQMQKKLLLLSVREL